MDNQKLCLVRLFDKDVVMSLKAPDHRYWQAAVGFVELANNNAWQDCVLNSGNSLDAGDGLGHTSFVAENIHGIHAAASPRWDEAGRTSCRREHQGCRCEGEWVVRLQTVELAANQAAERKG